MQNTDQVANTSGRIQDALVQKQSQVSFLRLFRAIVIYMPVIFNFCAASAALLEKQDWSQTSLQRSPGSFSTVTGILLNFMCYNLGSEYSTK